MYLVRLLRSGGTDGIFSRIIVEDDGSAFPLLMVISELTVEQDAPRVRYLDTWTLALHGRRNSTKFSVSVG